MARNYSHPKVKTIIIGGSILLSISSTTILCMEESPGGFKPPTKKNLDTILAEMNKIRNKKNPSKKTSSLTLSLRGSTSVEPEKPKLDSLLSKKLDICFEAIRENNRKKLPNTPVIDIDPSIVYDGYEESLLGAYTRSWELIKSEPYQLGSTRAANAQSILSFLLRATNTTKAEENDNAKK